MTSRLLVDKIEGKTSSGTVHMPSGSVVQVVTATSGSDGSAVDASTTTYVDGGGESEVSITPKFNNSKILVTATVHTDNKATDNRALFTFFKSVDGGSYANVAPTLGNRDSLARVHTLGDRILVNQTLIFFETITSTSNLKYRVYVRSEVASENASFRNDIIPIQIVAMEIAQ